LTDEAITDGVNGNRTSNYTYDFVGNRQTKTINGVTTTYAYDANDRLRTEKVGSNVTATYDYDNNGSTTQKVENGVTTSYVWNDEKRLVSATVGTTQVEYVYNDQGIRISSKQNGVETRYLLDEGIVANVWEEYAPNGTVQASYVYGYDLITQTQAGQTSYYLVDGLGSTRLLTDTQGQVLNAYGYEAFGESTSQSGTASNKYQYAGEQFDSTLGDYYLRQRFYDTSSGRFGRMDTYEGRDDQPITLNKYVYAYNNSITLTDPTGFAPSPLSDFFDKYGGSVILKDFYRGMDKYVRQMIFGSIVGSKIRKDIALNHIDHTVQGEVRVPYGRSEKAKYGKIDMLVYRPPLMQAEIYEIKPYHGDSPEAQLNIYLKGLAEKGIIATRGTYGYMGTLQNTPMLGVKITYEYDGPGAILYTPSLNHLGQALLVYMVGISLMMAYNRLQASSAAKRLVESLVFTKGLAI
jgi:RHS repeat-associated protein